MNFIKVIEYAKKGYRIHRLNQVGIYFEVIGNNLCIIDDVYDSPKITKSYSPSLDDICATDWALLPLDTFKVTLKVQAELELYVPAKDFVDAKEKAKQMSPSRANFVKYDYSTLEITDRVEKSEVRA